MLASAAFVLPADVFVVPVGEFTPEFARRSGAEHGDFAVSRPRGRAPACFIDRRFAAFLAEFRAPRTIAAAIVAYAGQHQIDANALLDSVLPLLARLVDASFLIPADQHVRDVRTPVRFGDEIGPFTIVTFVSVMNDTEVYCVVCPDGTRAALKIAAGAAADGTARGFEHEAAVIERLDGRINPRLLAIGAVNERPYLQLEWCVGEPVAAAAERVRSVDGLSGVRDLAIHVLEAFAHLHAQGVVHGDVHPGNVLCARGATITVVDYALAIASGLPHPAGPRGGVGFFFEPEFIASRGTAAATARGEQYALAALLFTLFTGETYLDFSLEKERAFGQILNEPPRSFAACGAPAWPAVEAVLARSLEKEPHARFGSVAAFARALAAAPPSPTTTQRGRVADLRRYAASALATVDVGSVVVPEPPTVSVTFGAAGIALACLRMACVSEDPSLLALAELWTERAANAIADDAAFHCERLGITPAAVGAISPYHCASGLHAVQMLVASAQGDLARVERALSAFMAASSQHCDGLDLMLGKSGVLAVAATLLDWVPYAAPASRARLLAFGDSLASALWTRLSGMAAIGAAPEMPTLGIAHGWAGVLFAVLSWSLAAGQPPPAAMRERLNELADQRVPWASGARWPIGLRDGDHVGFATSWCNGSSGYVFLWTAARAALGDDRFLEFAEDAAWNVWEGSRGSGNLCCGEAGAAYALLNLYRASGDVRWRARAEQLAYRASDFAGADAAQYSGYRQSLFKGALGIAVLAADLAEPQRARLPFFEPDAYAR